MVEDWDMVGFERMRVGMGRLGKREDWDG